jgi:hypothetical protein
MNRARLLDLGAGEDTADAVDAAIEAHEPAVGPAGLAVIGTAAIAVDAELLATEDLEPTDGVGVLLRYT